LEVDSAERGDGALTLKEESCLVGNQITGKVLRRVHQAGDDSSPQIGAFEKVEEGRGSTHLRLDLNGSLDHGKFLLSILFRFAAEALD
jgi:hypothetical protein